MRGYSIILGTILTAVLLSGCAEVPIKDGELVVGANTTASIEDIGAVRVTNHF